VPGSMSPKPLTSNRGHSWAVGRADGYVGYFRGARGPPEQSPWTREPRPWHLCLSGGLGREKSRVRGRKARSGEDPVMAKGPI
jgi:hypothetical protein